MATAWAANSRASRPTRDGSGRPGAARPGNAGGRTAGPSTGWRASTHRVSPRDAGAQRHGTTGRVRALSAFGPRGSHACRPPRRMRGFRGVRGVRGVRRAAGFGFGLQLPSGGLKALSRTCRARAAGFWVWQLLSGVVVSHVHRAPIKCRSRGFKEYLFPVSSSCSIPLPVAVERPLGGQWRGPEQPTVPLRASKISRCGGGCFCVKFVGCY